MLPILGVIAGIVVLAILVVLVLASTRPPAFRVERSASIQGPAEKVFAVLNDFHQWPSWSPWEKLDPAMNRTHSGSPSGKGAIYSWKGNKKVGEGRMEILDSVPPTRLTIKLDFLAPFEAHNTTEFSLEAQGDSTKLTWAMHGAQPFMLKVMGVFMSMDKTVGKDFETGLANIKNVVEKRA